MPRRKLTLDAALKVVLKEALDEPATWKVSAKTGYIALRPTREVLTALEALCRHVDEATRPAVDKRRAVAASLNPGLVGEVDRLRHEHPRWGRASMARYLQKNGHPEATEKIVRNIMRDDPFFRELRAMSESHLRGVNIWSSTLLAFVESLP